MAQSRSQMNDVRCSYLSIIEPLGALKNVSIAVVKLDLNAVYMISVG